MKAGCVFHGENFTVYVSISGRYTVEAGYIFAVRLGQTDTADGGIQALCVSFFFAACF